MENIIIDPTDLKGMRVLMKEYGDSETAYFGTNTDDETQLISIFHNRIVIVTYHDDGGECRNIYYDDGTKEIVYTPMQI